MKRVASGVLLLFLAIGCRHLPFGNHRFEGNYTSNWGDGTFVSNGDVVDGVYPNGTLSCDVRGDRLDCTWKEGGLIGRATFVRQSDGSLVGTWGSKMSATDGGSWTFTPKP